MVTQQTVERQNQWGGWRQGTGGAAGIRGFEAGQPEFNSLMLLLPSCVNSDEFLVLTNPQLYS